MPLHQYENTLARSISQSTAINMMNQRTNGNQKDGEYSFSFRHDANNYIMNDRKNTFIQIENTVNRLKYKQDQIVDVLNHKIPQKLNKIKSYTESIQKMKSSKSIKFKNHDHDDNSVSPTPKFGEALSIKSIGSQITAKFQESINERIYDSEQLANEDYTIAESQNDHSSKSIPKELSDNLSDHEVQLEYGLNDGYESGGIPEQSVGINERLSKSRYSYEKSRFSTTSDLNEQNGIQPNKYISLGKAQDSGKFSDDLKFDFETDKRIRFKSDLIEQEVEVFSNMVPMTYNHYLRYRYMWDKMLLESLINVNEFDPQNTDFDNYATQEFLMDQI